ncbi:uncharacterized protein BDZ99DRAFT_462044 [Mytilinidion resinicola]|uniref:Uncharacterized protein n=1 Tax=Mytilinidion resinicola TaxID=574789 RepID=A0A6A6YPJ4_9PEZI|nr:uncharacterized protein BDZ99DRAFT_462044 [Mytilinidion resinicola]KAF2810700.1 hypothetical protein BDZ99DRAFT_462044 [Mytilinidion resinicola]
MRNEARDALTQVPVTAIPSPNVCLYFTPPPDFYIFTHLLLFPPILCFILLSAPNDTTSPLPRYFKEGLH